MLISWIAKLLGFGPPASPREEEQDLPLYLTRLEDRQVLDATFSAGAGNLNLAQFGGTTSNVDVTATATGYTFKLDNGIWTGAAAAGVTRSADKTTLTVDTSLINGTININDSAALSDVTVQFLNSGGNDPPNGTFVLNSVGNVTLAGDPKCASLSITAPLITVSSSTITTTGTQTYTGDVSLSTNVNFTGSTVQFNDKILGGANNLTVTGNAIFGDAAADSVTAGDLLVSGTTTIKAGTISGSTLTFSGDVSLSNAVSLVATTDITVAGAFDANAKTLTLDGGANVSIANVNNDFATVKVTSANNVTLVDKNSIDLGASTVSGSLSVTALGGGNIAQSGALTVAGTSTFTAVGDNITLTNAANDFGGAVTSTGAVVSLTDANSIVLGSTSATTLNVTALGSGTITQSGALTVTGTASFTAAGDDITLTNTSNNFGGAVSATGDDVALTDANSIVLGTITATTLNVTALGGGAITQTAALTVTGTASFTATGGGDVTLTNTNNDFQSAVSVSGANIDLTDKNSIILGTIAASTLDVTALGTGTITQTGPLNVSGASGFTAAGDDITLTDAANDFGGAVSATGANVALTDANSIVLGTISATTLNVTALGSGTITQTGPLTVTGVSSFTATGDDITLTNTTNDFQGAVSASGANIDLTDKNSIILGTISASTLDVIALGAGNITQSGVLTITGASSFTAAGDDVILTNVANDFGGAVSATAANVSLTDANSILLGTIGATTLNVTALGSGTITQSGVLTVTGASSFTAAGDDITLTNASNNFGGAVSAAGDDVALTDADSIVLGTITASTLDVTALGAGTITQTGALTVTGTSTFTAAGDNITLTNAANDFGGAVSATGAAVALTDANSILLGTIGATTLNVTALGAGTITQSGALTVTGTSSFTAAGDDITLTNTANDFGGAVSATGDDVALTDANSIVLGAITAATLNVTALSNGTITQTAALTVTGVSSFTALGDDVTLTNTTNDFQGAVSANGANIDLTDKNSIILGTISAGTLDVIALSSGNIAQSGPLSVSGASSFTAAGDDITLTDAANDFGGAVTATGANVALTDANNIVLGTISATTLNVIALGAGTITQSGVLTVSGVSSFTAVGDDITLTNTANDFGGAVSATGDDVALTDAGSIVLGTISAGTLNVTALGAGTITQTGAVTVTGISTFTAVANAITLTNAANDFGGAVSVTGDDVSLTDVNAIDLGASTITGNLTVTAGGPVTDSGAVTVAGTTTLAAGAANDITLDSAGNDFQTVKITSGKNVTLVDADDVDLGASTVSGNLNVTAGGPITDSGNLVVTGTATFTTAPLSNITLDSTGNDFGGAVSATGSAVTLTDANSIVLGTISATTLNVTALSTGTIAQIGALTVTGASTFTAVGDDITLTDATNDFGGAVSATGDDVAFTDANGIVLGTISATTLNVIALSNGTITQSGVLTVTGASSFTAAGDDITLTNAANDFQGAVSASGDDIDLTDKNNIILGTISASTLNVTALNAGNITQSGPVTVTGTSTFTALGDDITLTNAANDFGGAVSATGAAVSLTDANSIVLGTISATTLNVTALSGGTITQSGVLTVTGASSFTASGDDITLTNPANNFGGAVAAVGDDVALTDQDSIVLGTITAGTLNVTALSNGTITQTGPVTVTGASTFTALGDDITLTNVSNNFVGAVSATGDDVAFTDADSIILGTISATTLNVTALSNGTITQTGILTVTGVSSFTAAGDDITLTDAANDFGGAVSATGDDVALTDANSIVLGTISATTLNVTALSSGTITQTAALTVTGVSTFTAAGDDITLTNTANDFQGAVSANGANIDLTDKNSIVLGTISASTLDVIALSTGTITQSGPLTVSGASSFTALGDDITLTNVGNDFGGAVSATGASVSLTDANSIILGTISATTLNVTALGAGTITQSGVLTVTGASSFTALGDDITLTNAANDFSGAVSATGDDVALTDADSIVLGTITATTLNVTALGNGTITQTGPLTVTGVSTFTAVGNAVTLTNAANDFGGAVSVTGDDVSLTDADDIDLGAVAATGNFSVTAGGPITDSGTVTVAGMTTLAAGAANDITLDSAGNDFQTVKITSGNNVTLVDATGIDLGASTVSGNLTLTTSGPITDSGNVIVAGTMTLTAGAANNVTLNSAGNDFNIVVINSGNDATVRDANSLTIRTSTVAGTLTLNANVLVDSSVTLNASAVVFQKTLDGAFDVLINGDAEFDGVVGNSTPLNSLRVTGASAFHATLLPGQSTVVTTTTQRYQGDATITANAIFAGTTVRFDGNIAAGAHSFTVTGDAIFGDALTDTVVAGPLSVSGTTTINAATVTTSGNTQSYQGNVTLGTDVTLTGTTVTFGGLVDGTAADSQLLDVEGSAVFNGRVGSLQRLTSVVVMRSATFNAAGTVASPTVKTLGTQAYGSSTADNITLAADTVLTGSTITMSGATDDTTAGQHVLDIQGSAVINARVGDTTLLKSVNVTGDTTLNATGSTAHPTIGTTGTQHYGDDALLDKTTLQKDTVLKTTTATVTFDSAVDGTVAGTSFLNIQGSAAFNALVGNLQSLQSVTVTQNTTFNAAGSVVAPTVKTTSTQQYGDDAGADLATLLKDTVLQGSTITFTSQIDGAAAGGQLLDIQGNAEFDGRVGSSVALKSVNVTGDTTLNAAGTLLSPTVHTTLTQQYGDNPAADDITLQQDTVLVGSTIIFNGSVNGTVNGQQSLDIQANAEFHERVGGGHSLEFLHVTGTALIDAAGVTTSNAAGGTGNQTYDDDATLGKSTTLTAAGVIDFEQTVQGPFDLTLVGTGSAVIKGAVGTSATPLGDGTGRSLILRMTGAAGMEFQSTVDTNQGILQFNSADEVTFRDNVTVHNSTSPTTFNANVVLDGLTFTSPGAVTFGNAATDTLAISPVDPTGVTIDSGSGLMRIRSLTTLNQTLTIDTDNAASEITGVLQGVAGLTKEGMGQLALAAVNTYTGATNVNAGTLLVNGSTAAASAFTVRNSATLGGSGVVNGAVTLLDSAHLAPGGTPGTLTTGSVTFPAGTSFDVEIGGTAPGSLDQLNVDRPDPLDATVDLNGPADVDGVTLNLSFITFTPGAGQRFIILANDGTDPIDGHFFGGAGSDAPGVVLAEGAIVSTDFGGSGLTARITYAGGDGNDVAIIVDGQATFDGTAAGDNFELRRITDVPSGLDNIQLLLNGNVIDSRPYSTVHTTGYQINGLAGNDSLNVNFSPIWGPSSGGFFDLPVVFDGGDPGASPGDSLLFTAATVDSVTHTFTDDNNGTVTIVKGGVTATVTYLSLEEPIQDNLTAADRVFQFSGVGETVTVSDSGTSGVTTIDSQFAGQTVNFVNPTASLAIRGGDGEDTIKLDGFGAGFHAALSVDGEGPADEIQVNTPLSLGSGTVTGNLMLTAEIIKLNNGTINTDQGTTAGTATFNGNVNLGADVTIDATNATTSATAFFNDALTGTTDGAEQLNVVGHAVFNAQVGTAALKLESLSVTNDTTLNAGSVFTTGTQRYGDDAAVDQTTLQKDTTLTASTVTFDSTVKGTTDGAEQLNVVGHAVFNAQVGTAALKLESLSVTNDTTLNAGSVFTTLTQRYGDDPAVDQTTLQKDTTLTASTVTFDSTVKGTIDGAEQLNVIGHAVFNAQVGTAALHLESLSVTNDTTLNAGSVFTTLTQRYGDDPAVDQTTLQKDTTLTASTVTFDSTVKGTTDGAEQLNVVGHAVFNAQVGTAALKLESLSVTNDTTLNAGSVFTTGTQRYGDDPAIDQTTLQKDTTLTASTVTFDSTVKGTTDGAELLNVVGHAVFNAQVGTAVLHLESLSVTNDTTLNAGSVFTTLTQRYGDDPAVDQTTLQKDTTLTASTVTFDSTVKGTTNGAELLNVVGHAVFNAQVGTAALKLESLSVTNDTTLNAGSVFTTSTQHYGDDPVVDQTTLQKDTTLTASTVTFDSTVKGTTDGAEQLNVVGHAVFNAQVGTAALKLESLSVTNDTTLNAGSVFTTGTQRYGDDPAIDQTTLQKDTTLTASTVTFDSTVKGTTDGAELLNVVGHAVFNAQVGTAVLHLESLSVTNDTTLNAGSVFTTGTQRYGDDPAIDQTTLQKDTTLTASTVTFDSTVKGTTNGAELLNVVGHAVFNAQVGTAALKLESLSVTNDTTLNAGSVFTTSTQHYGDDPVVDQTTLQKDTTLTASTVTFDSTVKGTTDGAEQLNVVGHAVFNAQVGTAALKLESLSVTNDTTLNAGSVFTALTQRYGDDPAVDQTTLQKDTTLTASTVTFDSTVKGTTDGAEQLNVVGHAVFNAQVGTAALKLESLSVTNDTTLNAGSVFTTLTQRYGDDPAVDQTTLQKDTTLTASTVTFDSTVKGTTDGAEQLNVVGHAVFNAQVGTGALKLESLSVTNDTTLNAGSVFTTLTQHYGDDSAVDQTTLQKDTTLTASTVTFDSTVDATAAGAQSLTVSGKAEFHGVVGATPLEVLHVTGTTLIDTTAITTSTADGGTGNQNYDGAATLSKNATLTSTGHGDVVFADRLDADVATNDRNLTIVDAKNVTFTGLVGNSQPLASITQTGGTGTTTFNGATLRADLNITTVDIVLQNAPVTTNTINGAGVTLTASQSVNLDAAADLNATDKTITISTGTQGFTQAVGNKIETDNTTAAAIDIKVNGTGNANIAEIEAGTIGVGGRVAVAALGGSILDVNGAAINVKADSVDLSAKNAIGTIDTFQQLTGDPIEIQVGSIFRATTTAAGSAIHLAQTGSLTIAPLSIGIAGAEQASAIIRATGDIDAGAANSIDLFGNDNLALVAGGKVTVPTAGFNTAVTGKPAGDLIMSGNDIVALGGSRTMNFAANQLFFSSQAPGGDPLGSDILNTDLNKITVRFGNGTDVRNLTINEDQGAFPSAIDQAGLRGLNINVLKGDLLLKSTGTITDDDVNPMDLTKTVLTKTVDVHATNITLDVAGSGLGSPQVAAAAGERNIDLRADANLTIKGSGIVLEVSGGNDVTGIAGGTAKIEPGAFIRSFDPAQPTTPGVFGQQPPAANPGVAGQLPGDPNYAINVVTPQVTALGEAEFHITFGQAGERNYTLTIDWSDGTVETFTALAGGTEHVYTHTYSPDNLPDPGNPSAPIPMVFTLVNDPNINFSDSSAPTTVQVGSTTSGSTTNFTATRSGIDLSVLTGVALAPVPGDGFATKRIDTSPKVEFLGIPRVTTADAVHSIRENFSAGAQSAEVRAAVADLTTNQEDAVILEIISPDDQVVDRIPLRLDVLKDLDALYRRLPDGKYRLLLRRDGREVPIFREMLVLRGGRVIDATRVEEAQDSPGGNAPAKAKPAAEKMSLRLSPEEIDRLWQHLLVEQALAEARARPAAVPAPRGEIATEPPADTPRKPVAPAVESPAPTVGSVRAVDNQPADSESEQGGESSAVRRDVSGQPLAGAAALLGIAAVRSREPQRAEAVGSERAPRLAARLWRVISRWLRKG